MEVLPDELVSECLLRVPYTSHHNLKAVCRSWDGIVSSPHFYAERNISGKSQQLICFIQKDPTARFGCVITIYDPLNDTWKRLPPIDDLHFPRISVQSQCVAVNRKLVLITGVVPYSGPLQIVYIYDFESARWSRGADMPTPRSSFACSVSSSNGLVYVAGGINELYTPLAAVETYNVEEDRWEILPPMIQPHARGCHGVFIEDKFMVLSGLEFDRSAEIFNPSAGTWSRWEDLGNSRGAVSSSTCSIYVFNERRLMKYDRENNVWTHVAYLPRRRNFITCATEWGDWIFVSTCGFIREEDMSYLFNPSTGRWIEVNGDGFVGMVVSAATVKI